MAVSVDEAGHGAPCLQAHRARSGEPRALVHAADARDPPVADEDGVRARTLGIERVDDSGDEQILHGRRGYLPRRAARFTPTRTRAVLESLRARAIPDERLRRLKAPAGLDLGAVTPVEIAISILAEIVQHHRSDKTVEAEAPSDTATPTEAIDPICGMSVEIASARYRSDVAGRTTYFCCLHCKETFDGDPGRYLAAR